MQVDFYQLTRDPAEKLAPVLAQKVMDVGKRLLIISTSKEQRDAISKAMWQDKPESFLAHADTVDLPDGAAATQPILLSDMAQADNQATYMLIADGQWRGEIEGMERIFYLFQPEHTDNARNAWRSLADVAQTTRKYWRQDGGRWVEGP